ncbi:hypothetical protein FACS189459_7000 [Bacilli bacterium]|nr:hypothetical protein FACS189459_7000 [Bacilli bacterium]
MIKQNENLINFIKESTFLYNNLQLDSCAIIGLFDDNFNQIDKTTNNC